MCPGRVKYRLLMSKQYFRVARCVVAHDRWVVLVIDVGGSLRRAAVGVSRRYRLSGAVEHLEALARAGVTFSADDHRLYFMVWQASRVLDIRPRDSSRPERREPVASC